MLCTAREGVRLSSTGSSVYVTAVEKRNSREIVKGLPQSEVNLPRPRFAMLPLPTLPGRRGISTRCAGLASVREGKRS